MQRLMKRLMKGKRKQSELASKLGISLVHVNKNMKKLQSLGIIRRVGSDKGGHWEVVE